MKALTNAAFLAALATAVPAMTLAQDTRTETVHFKSGETSATIKGRIKGYESVDYILGATKGQSMTVSLKASNASNYFNIYTPGAKPGEDQAMFIGSTQGNEFTGTLPASGDYLIQVYLMRNAARRDETSSYTLEAGIDG